jgi:hypothetical protein
VPELAPDAGEQVRFDQRGRVRTVDSGEEVLLNV